MSQQYFDETHRRVNPARESVGSDLYVVTAYDPVRAVCDLIPASINQRGVLKAVPICQPFGGSWEFQAGQSSQFAQTVQPAKFGNVSRGPRWGINLPVQPGDLCLVQYAGESMSDPIITAFYRRPNDFGLAWSANQILSQKSDYSELTPKDDDELSDRFDVLLPSGAWFRSSKSGSWVMATAPCDRPTAFITLDANGSFRIKARGQSDYNIHLEFDSATESGRICVGTLGGGSFLEFKDGDITIRAKRNIKIQGQRVDGDLKPQHTPALDAIASGSAAPASPPSTPATPQSQPQLASLANQAIGEQIIAGGALTPEPSKPGVVVVKPNKKDLISNLISNPAIDGAIRGQMGDLLSDPQGLLSHALGGFGNGMNPIDIGSKLTGLLGANALTGNLSQITSQLDLGNLDLVKQLGIPSWISQTIQTGIQLPNLQLPDVLSHLSGLSDSGLLSEVMKWAGSGAIDLGTAPAALSQLQGMIGQLPTPLKNRVNGLLENIDSIPVKTPTGDNGAIDWHQTTAQRLGAHILRGNTMLGGKANLFDLSQLQGLVDGNTMQAIGAVAGQIEDYFANPHPLVNNFDVGHIVKQYLPQLAKLPPELRDLFSTLGSGDLSNLSPLAGQALEAVSDLAGGDLDELSAIGRGLSGLDGLLKGMPGGIQGILSAIPQEFFSALAGLPTEQIQGILQNPANVLNVDNDMLRSVFGQGFSKAAGTFDVRVSKIAKFNTVPRSANGLEGLNLTEEYHLQSFSYPITRVAEYGAIDLPDYWAE